MLYSIGGPIMAKDMNLTAEEIYSKEFHVDLKGYASSEVDEFLDQIIEDYQKYDEKLEELGQAISRYEAKVKELNQQIYVLNSDKRQLEERVANGIAGGNNSDQVDLLQRIARLEAAVFQDEKAPKQMDVKRNNNNHNHKNKNKNKNKQNA